MHDDEPFGHEPSGDEDVDPLLPPGLVSIDPAPAPPVDPAPTAGVPHRYRRSMGATVLAAGLLGLRDALEEPRDDRPVVEQHADESDRERSIEVDLDPDDPSASVVRLRPRA